MRAELCAAVLLGAALVAPAAAADKEDPKDRAHLASVEVICSMIERAAEEHGLPKPFFARLIWKESRFDVKAVSPVGAQGVAQFMPATARERGLKDPFDPLQAIPASASFLADLRTAFGNLGLAAAAYNGGPDRVARWLNNRAGLAAETHDYVQSITGRPADWFRQRGREVEAKPLEDGVSFQEGCRKMRVIATRAAPRPPWGVVVAGGRNHNAARIAFERARRRAPQIISASNVHILRRSKRKTGPLYFAVIGANDQREAQRLCLKIRNVGGPCTIRRN